MTRCLFLCVLHLACAVGLSSADRDPVLGLQELTRDILEKIKAATGQPIDTRRFYPILADSSEGVEAHAKATAEKQLDGDEGSRFEKDRFFERAETGKDGEALASSRYGDHWGTRHRYNEGRFVKKNHHKSDGGSKGYKGKKGKKHRKHHVEKGFRDIYHKDEETKSDFYWNNHHEEGKWLEYGFKNQKKAKSHDKGDEGKHQKSGGQESSYEKKEDKCTKCSTR